MSGIQKLLSISVALTLVMLIVMGCTPDEEAALIQVSKNVTSLTAGQSETIEVQALTAKGKSVPFSMETEGNCISVSTAAESITVTAGTELCEQTVTIKAGSAKEKTITVIVYDPMAMDIGKGLLIRYTNKYQLRGSLRGKTEVFGFWLKTIFWHPITDVENGWYPLGSLILPENEDVASHPMIVVKDSRDGGLLAAPNKYELVWRDTNNTQNSSIWKAVCPDGFVSFGVVTTSTFVEPSPNDIRCMSKDFTWPAALGNIILTDRGSKSGLDVSIWNINYPEYTKSPDGRAALLTGANLACPGYEASRCDESWVNLLLVPLPVYSYSENTTQPKLTGREPLDTAQPRFFSSVRVPFTLVISEFTNASPERIKLNIEKSPFYYVQREEMYTPIDIMNNAQGKKDAEYHYQISTGYSQTDQEKFSHEVGIKVTAGGECSFLGTGGKWEVELSYKFGWEKSISNTYSQVTTRDFTFTVPAGAYAEIIQVTNQFRAIPMTEEITTLSEPFNMNSNIIMYLQYPPPSPPDE